MSLYPFINPKLQPKTIEQPLALYKEYAWDFKNDKPLIINNEFKVVEKNEAIKVWIYHAIKTYRYTFSIYSWDFGTELDKLLGQPYTVGVTKSEANRYVKEALEINPYIKEIIAVKTDFYNDVLDVYVKVKTIYGEMEVSFGV